MKGYKAQPASKPRESKTWRIRQDILKVIKEYAKKYKKSESEIIEGAILNQFPL